MIVRKLSQSELSESRESYQKLHIYLSRKWKLGIVFQISKPSTEPSSKVINISKQNLNNIIVIHTHW